MRKFSNYLIGLLFRCGELNEEVGAMVTGKPLVVGEAEAKEEWGSDWGSCFVDGKFCVELQWCAIVPLPAF